MSFELSEQENKILKKWLTKHDKKCRFSCGIIGGRLTYIFNPTSLGCLITVQCGCGGKICLTDIINEW